MKRRLVSLSVWILLNLGFSALGAAQSLPNLGTAASVKLAWNAPDDPSVVGYRIYHRTSYDADWSTTDIGPEPQGTLDGLQADFMYYMTVTAFNVHGLESAPSNEIMFRARPSDVLISDFVGQEVPAIVTRVGHLVDVYGKTEEGAPWVLLGSIVNTGDEILFRVPGSTVTMDLSELDHMAYHSLRFESRGESLEAWMTRRNLSDPDAPSEWHGISNLQAFLTGADLLPTPFVAIPKVEIVPQLEAGRVSHYATLTYTVRDNVSGYDIMPESSSDGIMWDYAADRMIMESRLFNGDGTFTITLREDLSFESGALPEQYYRLRFVPLNESMVFQPEEHHGLLAMAGLQVVPPRSWTTGESSGLAALADCGFSLRPASLPPREREIPPTLESYSIAMHPVFMGVQPLQFAFE